MNFTCTKSTGKNVIKYQRKQSIMYTHLNKLSYLTEYSVCPFEYRFNSNCKNL